MATTGLPARGWRAAREVQDDRLDGHAALCREPTSVRPAAPRRPAPGRRHPGGRRSPSTATGSTGPPGCRRAAPKCRSRGSSPACRCSVPWRSRVG